MEGETTRGRNDSGRNDRANGKVGETTRYPHDCHMILLFGLFIHATDGVVLGCLAAKLTLFLRFLPLNFDWLLKKGSQCCGPRVASSVCFESLFPSEIRRSLWLAFKEGSLSWSSCLSFNCGFLLFGTAFQCWSCYLVLNFVISVFDLDEFEVLHVDRILARLRTTAEPKARVMRA